MPAGDFCENAAKTMPSMLKLFWSFLLVCLVSSPAIARGPLAAKVETLVKTSSSWNGQMLPDYPSGRPEVTILRIAVPAGMKLPLHKHPVINAGVMTKGELTVTTSKGEVLHLREGDTIVEVVDTWHYGENRGNETAEIIVFYAGIKGAPLSIKSGDSR